MSMLLELLSFVSFFRERDISVIKVSREANMASHELAKLGLVKHRTAVWLMDFPSEIAEAIAHDCNPSAS